MKTQMSIFATLRTSLLLSLSFVFAVSCTADYLPDGGPSKVPSDDDVYVNLNLLGAQQNGTPAAPPQERSMPNGGDAEYANNLVSLVFYKENASTPLKYFAVRPVVKESGNSFKIALPGTLIGKQVKVHIYSNAQPVLGNSIYSRFETKVTPETQVINELTMQRNQQWDCASSSYMRIPMYGATEVFNLTTSTKTLSPISLRRMLARVDVGTNYNGTTEGSTAQTLRNFKLVSAWICNTKDKGQLISNNQTTVTVPGGGAVIGRYKVTGSATAIEREIYLFEQDIDNTAGFKADRPCLVIEGSYSPNPTDASPIWVPGFYRVDFYEVNNYLDVVRNTLYRFNITNVSGIGQPSVDDALNNVASNVTVMLQNYSLEQNDVEFNGQDYLAVSKSVFSVFSDRRTDYINLGTSYSKGWKLEFPSGSPLNASHFSPNSGSGATAGVDVTLTLPGGFNMANNQGDKEFFVVAGNLKKRMVVKITNAVAPDPLTQFSIPQVLYFAKGGGNMTYQITTNLNKAQLRLTKGSIVMDNMDGTANKTPGSAYIQKVMSVKNTTQTNSNLNATLEGGLEVGVTTENADVKASTKIIQYLNVDNSDFRVGTPLGAPGYDAMDNTLSATAHTGLRIACNQTAINMASAGRHHVIKMEIGTDPFSRKTVYLRATGLYSYTYVPIEKSKSYSNREVALCTMYPTSGDPGLSAGAEYPSSPDKIIDVVGHTPYVVSVKQSSVAKPSATMSVVYPSGATQYEWNAREALLRFADVTSNDPDEITEFGGKLLARDGVGIRLCKRYIEGSMQDVEFTSMSDAGSKGWDKVFELNENRTGTDRQVDVEYWLKGYQGEKVVMTPSTVLCVKQKMAPVMDGSTLGNRFKTINIAANESYVDVDFLNLRQANVYNIERDGSSNVANFDPIQGMDVSIPVYSQNKEWAKGRISFAVNDSPNPRKTIVRYQAWSVNQVMGTQNLPYEFTINQAAAEKTLEFDYANSGFDVPIVNYANNTIWGKAGGSITMYIKSNEKNPTGWKARVCSSNGIVLADNLGNGTVNSITFNIPQNGTSGNRDLIFKFIHQGKEYPVVLPGTSTNYTIQQKGYRFFAPSNAPMKSFDKWGEACGNTYTPGNYQKNWKAPTRNDFVELIDRGTHNISGVNLVTDFGYFPVENYAYEFNQLGAYGFGDRGDEYTGVNANYLLFSPSGYMGVTSLKAVTGHNSGIATNTPVSVRCILP